MNTISKKINAIIFAAVVASAPVYASEMQTTEQQDTAETSVVWYKKRSTHMVAAAAATAIGLYALAVRKNKIAGPVALFTALLCGSKNAQETKNADQPKDADKGNSDSATPEDQKTVSVDADHEKTENQQPVASGDVKSNDLSTTAAPLHMQVQQRAADALGSVKKWFTAGLIAEESSQN